MAALARAAVGWSSAAEFLDSLHWQAEAFRLDRTQGQPTKLIVLCEAAGMAPQLARVTDPYGVEVISSGGFESVTEQYRLAVEIANEGRTVEILHIGDHDPSGAHLYLALIENIAAFADQARRRGRLYTACRDTAADQR